MESYPTEFVQFLNLALQAAAAALAPLVIGFVLALIRESVSRVRASLSAAQWAAATAVVSTIVAAAEQSGLAGYISAQGAAKKAWAIDQIKRIIAERGLPPIDIDTLSAMIEAEVLRQFGETRAGG